jgi:hypothetical protein
MDERMESQVWITGPLGEYPIGYYPFADPALETRVAELEAENERLRGQLANTGATGKAEKD